MAGERDSVRRRTVLQSLGLLGTSVAGAGGAAAEPGQSEGAGSNQRDVAAPTRPKNLTCERETPQRATITWTASDDYPVENPSGIDHYEVLLGDRHTDRQKNVHGFLDNHEAGGGDSYAYTFTGLTTANGYRSYVRAVDRAGNRGPLASVAIPPITAEWFVHNCTDLGPLSERSWTSALTVNEGGRGFPTPDGGVEDGRVTRSGTTAPVAVAYELSGDVDSLSARFHKRRAADGWIDVYESTNGGSTWSYVDSSFDTYGGTDGEWLHHELRVDAFSEGVRDVKLLLTGGKRPDDVQLGNVEIEYVADTIPPAPVELIGEAVERPDELSIRWRDRSQSRDLDHYNVYFEGKLHTEVPADTTEATIGGLEPETTYTVGVSAVDSVGNESRITTADLRTAGVFVEDCSTLETAAFGTSTDRLTVDETVPARFDRPDGSTDGARITRTDTDDATLVYKVPGYRSRVTVEFHRHVKRGGELLINGFSAKDADNPGSIEQYGADDSDWAHEQYTMPAVVDSKAALTITGGSEAGASQIGHVEITYVPVEGKRTPPEPQGVEAVALSESAVQVSWERGRRRSSAYHALSVDGERVYETIRPDESFGAVLTGLSSGTHEIGVSAVSRTHTESAITTTTVDVPTEPMSTFVDDCSSLASLSGKSSLDRLHVDRSNAAYFQRPDGSTDGARFVRMDPHGVTDVVYATPKPVTSVTAEFHEHAEQGGGLEVYESMDEGRTWSRVDATVDTYDGTDANWNHHELTASTFARGTTHLKLTLTDHDGAAWSPELGNVLIHYADP